MQVLIEIPKASYEMIKEMQKRNGTEYMNELETGVANGTPLPEGHNILDENKVIMGLVYGNLLKDDVKCGDITSILKDARIIEADKEREE